MPKSEKDYYKIGDYVPVERNPEYVTNREKFEEGMKETDEFGEELEHGFLGPRTGISDKR